MTNLTPPAAFAAIVATRAIKTTDALLAELSADSKKLVFPSDAAELVQQVVKIALSLDNLHIAQHPALNSQHDELRDRYFALIRLLLRIADELDGIVEKV